MFNPNPGMSHLDYTRLLPAVSAPVPKSSTYPHQEKTSAGSESAFIQKPSSTSRKELIEYKKLLTLTEIQKETAVGILLGDGSLQSQSKKNNNTAAELHSPKSWRLKFCYSQKHQAYAEHIHDVFSDWCLSKPVLSENRNSIAFQTISHEKFKVLSDIFLLDKGPKGICPNLVENHVTARGLAYWFMDDGGKLAYGPSSSKGLVLNTQCFSKEEVENLAAGLNKKFDLQTWVKPNKKGHIVAISGKSYETFIEHVNPFMHDSMRYKLPTPRKQKLGIFILNDNAKIKNITSSVTDLNI